MFYKSNKSLMKYLGTVEEEKALILHTPSDRSSGRKNQPFGTRQVNFSKRNYLQTIEPPKKVARGLVSYKFDNASSSFSVVLLEPSFSMVLRDIFDFIHILFDFLIKSRRFIDFQISKLLNTPHLLKPGTQTIATCNLS